MEWSLRILLENLHDDIQNRLSAVRKTLAHPGAKGDGSENIWLKLFNLYLPKRYQADKAHVVDSLGKFSEQMDVVVFDRQYSPFVFNYEGQKIIPAESVYAVFEAKQTINKEMVDYAQKKVSSVRKLHRTSLPIPYAKGTYPAKPLIPIIGGILTLDSDWKPPLGDSLHKQLSEDINTGRLDIGCCAAHGYFQYDKDKETFFSCDSRKSATAFLFELISMLQFSGTVPMIDIKAYSKWILDD